MALRFQKEGRISDGLLMAKPSDSKLRRPA